jgi:hypothetical protein
MTMLKIIAAASFACLLAGPAFASSGDAWDTFRAEVEQKCLEATSDILTDAVAVVDPFGSESFGLAIVTGEATPGTEVRIICVTDKQTGAVEIGGELPVL